MRVFITGVAGFLGSHLADAMLSLGHSVIGVDNLAGGERANVPVGVEFYMRDCRVQQHMLELSRKCDVVYHCAAMPHEGLSVFSPSIISDNIMGASVAVFSAAIANGVGRIVFCSSMARYGWGGPVPFTEDAIPEPEDPYGICKVAAEKVLQVLCRAHDVEWNIAVPHNIIGPRQKYDDPYRNVASIMVNRMLQGKAPIIYGNGGQTRCFSDIADVVPCLVKMGSYRDITSQIINIGPDEQVISILELFHILQDIMGIQMAPMHVRARPCEVRHAVCSSAKARDLLHYKTTVSLETSLRNLVDHIKQRGPKPFRYHLPVEIQNDNTPETWAEHLI